MVRADWSGEFCPVRRGLDVVGDPWSLLIMRDALHGRRRFEDFRSSLGIADSVLSRPYVHGTHAAAGLVAGAWQLV